MIRPAERFRCSREEAMKLLGVTAAYFTAHHIAYCITASEKEIMTVWPAGGIGLAAFLLMPRHLWPLLAGAFFVAGISADTGFHGTRLLAGVGYMTANLTESIGCALLILRLPQGDIRFERIQEVLALLLGALGVNAISAIIGAGSACLSLGEPFGQSWVSWYISDGLGILIITPLILAWRGSLRGVIETTGLRAVEMVLFFSFWFFFAWDAVSGSGSESFISPKPYMLIALLAWPAFRLGQRALTLGLGILAGLTITRLVLYGGTASSGGEITQELLAAQLFMGVASSTGLLLSAAVAESKAATLAARREDERHRAILHTAMDGYWLADKHGRLLEVNETYAQMSLYSIDELLSMRISDLDAGESEDEIAACIASLVGLGWHRFETRHRRKDGTIFDVEISARHQPFDSGRIIFFLRDITLRKSVDKVLQENNLRLTKLTSQLPGMLYQFLRRPDGSYCLPYCSDGIERLFGVTAEMVREDAHPMFERIHPDDLSRNHCEIDESAWNLTPMHCEYRVQLPGQPPMWRGCQSVPERLEDGSIIWHGFTMDITERKQMEEALKKSEANYRLLVNNLPDTIWIMSMEGNFTYHSPSVMQLRGCSPEEANSIPMQYSMTPESSERVRNLFRSEALKPAAEQFKNGKLELELYRKDGSTVWVESCYYAIRDSQSRPIALQGSTRDITERKRGEEALKTERDLITVLLASTEDTVAAMDEDYNILFMSGRLITIFGDQTGKKCYQAFCGFDKPCGNNCSVDELIIKNKPFFSYTHEDEQDIEERRITGDAAKSVLPHKLIWETVAKPFIYNGKRCVLEISHNITERKRAEEEKSSLQAQLIQSQKLESVGRLAGGVAHDFSNMLVAIMGYADLAMAEMDPENILYENLTEIRRAAERSASLTRQLLAFARRQEINPKLLDLNETLVGMLNMLRRLIGEHIELDWKPGRNLWQAKVDPAQIDQILVNLLVNARDAIRGNGRVTIETGNAVFDSDYCDSHPGATPGDYVKIVVCDTGEGMDEETLEHIFEPFFTTKNEGEGTGLGLATVYGIIKQNRGYIQVYSKPHIGATFSVYLPRYKGENLEKEEEQAPKPKSFGHGTILMVDDEEVILELGGIILRKLGYNVLLAKSPNEAIRLAKAHIDEIILLVTDVVMPEMNGRMLADEILSLNPAIKRLFMSGYTTTVISQYLVVEDGVSFLQKPFTLDSLAQKVSDALKQDSPS